MTHLPPLQALHSFLIVAEHGSFTHAAHALFLTQGAISRQIKGLESYYGTALFYRKARGLELTPEGQALLPAIKDAFFKIEEASRALIHRQSDLRIRCPATPAMRWLLPNLPAFQQRHPELTVHLITQLNHERPFDHTESDVAIMGISPEYDTTGLILEAIGQEVLVPVCSPKLLEQRPMQTPNDLRFHTLLHPWRGQHTWAKWLQLAGAHLVRPKAGVTFDTLEYALNAAVSGMGVTLAQVSMIRHELETGRLVIPFDTVLATEWGYYLIYPEQHQDQPKIRAFRDWLMQIFSKNAINT